MLGRRLAGLLVFGAMTALAGCFDDDDPPATDAGTVDSGRADTGTNDAGPGDVPVVDAGQRPVLRVTAPTANAMVPIGTPFTMAIAADNFALVPYAGLTTNTPGQGHYHVYLDSADNNDYLIADNVAAPQITLPLSTTPGAHTLRVSLRENTHGPITPAVDVTIPVMAMTSTAPGVTITTPASGTSVAAGASVTLMLAFTNFTLRDFMGRTGQVPNTGHYHIYLDDRSGNDYLVAEYGMSSTITLPAATTAGEHRLVVSLRFDDHTEITGANATLRINVTR